VKLNGDYSGSVTYDVGDIVRYTDGVSYLLLKPCKAGVPPINTKYWDRIPQPMQDVAKLIVSYSDVIGKPPALANNLTTAASGKALDARQGKALKALIDELDARVKALEPPPDAQEPDAQE
jgi:hypothetical protein